MRSLLIASLLLTPLAASAQHSACAVPAAADAGLAGEVGEVSFANSGAPGAQEAFRRGLALLHNFEYPTAAESFRKAQQLDPAFAMAYWGEAMTHTHPVWFQQDAPAARAVLAKLAPTPAERLAKAGSERERDYLRSVEVLYGEGSKEERDFKYADAMATLHGRYPEDVDATAFYALALLGTAHQGRDFAIYMRAAALLEEVFPAHRGHPGVLHYLIHSYDDPIHAPLGIRAARLYGAVAPSAGHALHMTSHIFIALGMWDDVVDSNRRAIAVVNAQRAARSKPPADCGHYPIWLQYAYLQEHRLDEAARTYEACRASAFVPKFESAGPMDTLKDRLDSYAQMRTQQIAGGGSVPAAAPLPDGADYAPARFTVAYGELLIAARQGDAATVRRAAAAVRELQNDALAAIDLEKSSNPSDRIRAQVIGLQANAFEHIAGGDRAGALVILEKAATAEASMPLDFGPPTITKPSHELLGEQLLLAGRAADAEAVYRTALSRNPGRTPALEGLLRAQKAAGHEAAAAITAAQLAPA
ncbi:MAG: Tetratricopeptide repeat-containing protein, partial [Acidobacteria bacterium]|nr:Tetratricopeptide repeat-containing protein [Acidobacteriota bacterium]